MDNRSFSNLRNREKSLILRRNFRLWKFNSLDNAGYFTIFQGFEESEKLKNISGNALKLYIYLGLHANNYEGIVWHSNRTISRYFNKSERTIRGWMKELEDLNLIKRMRLNYNGQIYTYLQPYEAKLEKNNTQVEGFIYFNEYGELSFQSQFKSKVLRELEYRITVYLENGSVIEGNIIKYGDGKYNFYSFDKEVKIVLDYYDDPEAILIVKMQE